MNNNAWPVALFAHNEEHRIVASLQSVARGSSRHPVQVYVLANGCSDRTESVVREFAESHPWVTLVSIPVGDKANAWNEFVYQLSTAAEVCFFVDGDIVVEPGAFDALYAALQAAPQANAAAAVPASGRSQRALESMVCEQRLLLGALYALRAEFVRRVARCDVRLPVGYIGEDGLVTSLVKWDLDPRGTFLHERITPCPRAKFTYRSFSAWNFDDWRTYWRRRIRYSLRHYQHTLLVPMLKSAGIAGMPRSVAVLYTQQMEAIRRCRPRGGLDLIFDSIAISRMRRGLR